MYLTPLQIVAASHRFVLGLPGSVRHVPPGGKACVALKTILWSESIRSRIEAGQAHFLSRASLKALSAGTLPDLFDIATIERPDLIMIAAVPSSPPADDLCRRLRADERTRRIPILALAGAGDAAERLRQAGCDRVLDEATPPEILQDLIASMLGIRLRRHPRFPVVLPVARGRIFHEFLGYTNAVSEGGMGFETISRIRLGEQLSLKIYRNTQERPIAATGRVAGVRPNIETGIGYAVGIEFMRLAATDRGRLAELFPADPALTWTSDGPPEPPPDPPPSPLGY